MMLPPQADDVFALILTLFIAWVISDEGDV